METSPEPTSRGRATADRSHAAPSAPGVWPYVRIARVDHWFKNVFMLFGVLLAFFYRTDLIGWGVAGRVLSALLATCLIASSNYVLNEWIDAPFDRLHPDKRNRPAARGLVRAPWVLVEWGLLALAGFALAFAVDRNVGLAGVLLWTMGLVYNVPPLRLKDVPYLDVVTESINNPIRLMLGWFIVIPDRLPPLSLVIGYWMAGAFFMAIKRLAEYRHIGDRAVAASYRRSFAHYDERRLLTSVMFYVTFGALFGGIFVVRYKLELILWAPVVAGFFAWYTHLGLRDDSPVQKPEALYRERGFFAYALFATALFCLLMFVEIPALYELFNVTPSSIDPLWQVGG